MEPALVVAMLWTLFAGTHMGLSITRVRAALVARLGEPGFFALFSSIASLGFWVLVAYYAAHRGEGAPGLDAGRVAPLRWLLMGTVAAGVVLVVAGLGVYPRLPVALFGQPIVTPRGIERISRHPFFVGMALVGGAHVLLAPHLAGAVFMGGFAVLGIAGARHQDSRTLQARGRPYAEYIAATSVLPLAAWLTGRQTLDRRALPLGTITTGLAVAVLLRLAHADLFAAGGAWIAGTTIVGGAVAGLQSHRRSRRVGALPTRGPTAERPAA